MFVLLSSANKNFAFIFNFYFHCFVQNQCGLPSKGALRALNSPGAFTATNSHPPLLLDFIFLQLFSLVTTEFGSFMHLGGTPGPAHPQVLGNVPFLVKTLGFASKKGSVNVSKGQGEALL